MGRALVFVHKKGSKDKFRKYGNKSCTLNKVSSKVTGFWSSPFRAHLQALRLRVERGGGVCQLPRLWTLTCPCCICCSRSGEGGSWRSGFLSSGFPAQLLKEHYLLQDYKSQEILDRCTLLKAGDKTQLCFLSWQGSRWRAQTEEEREEGLILSTYLCRRKNWVSGQRALYQNRDLLYSLGPHSPILSVTPAWDSCMLLEKKAMAEQGEQVGNSNRRRKGRGTNIYLELKLCLAPWWALYLCALINRVG